MPLLDPLERRVRTPPGHALSGGGVIALDEQGLVRLHAADKVPLLARVVPRIVHLQGVALGRVGILRVAALGRLEDAGGDQ